MDIQLYLGFPPTINSYYVKTARGIFISKKGREFRESVQKRKIEQLGDAACTATSISLDIVLYPPDRRKRDLDNYLKGLMDAITHTGLWGDDSYVDQLNVSRGVVVKGGLSFLRLQKGGSLLPLPEGVL